MSYGNWASGSGVVAAAGNPVAESVLAPERAGELPLRTLKH
jgi:hypothetical protein